MYEKIIRKFIHNMSVEDIKHYALKHNVELTTDEAIFIFKFLKENYELLLTGNTLVLDQIKPHVRPEVYNIAYKMYNDACNKYLK